MQLARGQCELLRRRLVGCLSDPHCVRVCSRSQCDSGRAEERREERELTASASLEQARGSFAHADSRAFAATVGAGASTTKNAIYHTTVCCPASFASA
jgi:hypothetical protein